MLCSGACQGSAKPISEAHCFKCRHLAPINKNENERPGGDNPADGTPQPDGANSFCGSFIAAKAMELVIEIVGT